MVAPESVFRIWRNRHEIEIEAAGIFARLADDLTQLRGADDEVAQLARTAAEDEVRHAGFCRKILSFSPGKAPEERKLEHPTQLGPPGLSLEDRVIYACVAVCCVTETLSTALLVEMYKLASPGVVKHTVHRVLADEVSHSRIGWAELARASRSRDLSWVSRHVPAMIRAALVSDVDPMLSIEATHEDLSPWGILSPSRAKSLIEETINGVIIPGLAQNGIAVSRTFTSGFTKT